MNEGTENNDVIWENVAPEAKLCKMKERKRHSYNVYSDI